MFTTTLVHHSTEKTLFATVKERLSSMKHFGGVFFFLSVVAAELHGHQPWSVAPIAMSAGARAGAGSSRGSRCSGRPRNRASAAAALAAMSVLEDAAVAQAPRASQRWPPQALTPTKETSA